MRLSSSRQLRRDRGTRGASALPYASDAGRCRRSASMPAHRWPETNRPTRREPDRRGSPPARSASCANQRRASDRSPSPVKRPPGEAAADAGEQAADEPIRRNALNGECGAADAEQPARRREPFARAVPAPAIPDAAGGTMGGEIQFVQSFMSESDASSGTGAAVIRV